MYFTPNHLGVSALLVLLAIPSTLGQTCKMTRDDTCKAGNWPEEFKCIMKSNSLRTVMDCVEIVERPGDDLEKFMCRPLDDGIANDAEQYYYRNKKKTGEWCTKPRTILMKGPLAYKDGKKLSINGALEACPENDPDFHNCLCMQNVKIEAMKALAQYFKKVKDQDLDCPKPPKKLTPRSTLFLDEIAETPHMFQERDNATDFHRHTLHPRALSEFTIDRYGRPVYAEDDLIGYPLPYWDQYLSRQLARRCYVHPEVNVIASCRTWRLAATVTTSIALSVRPNKAVYAQEFTPTAAQSTYSAPPEMTSIVVEQLVNQTNAVTTPTATATGAVETGGAGNMKCRLQIAIAVAIGAVISL